MDNENNIYPLNDYARFMPGYSETPESKAEVGNDDISDKGTTINDLSSEQNDANGNINVEKNKIEESGDNESEPQWLTKTATVLSAIFTPLMIPTYAYAIILLATPLSRMPSRVTFLSTVIVFIVTAVIPLSTLLLMMRKGKISEMSIDNKRQRSIPYLVTIACYLVTAYFLTALPLWVAGFFIGAAVACIIASIINVKWKISAHATGMGGITAMLVLIGLAHIATVLIIPWISMAILLSGAVCSARLVLGKHTLGQVFCGWLLGFISTSIVMLFI